MQSLLTADRSGNLSPLVKPLEARKEKETGSVFKSAMRYEAGEAEETDDQRAAPSEPEHPDK